MKPKQSGKVVLGSLLALGLATSLGGCTVYERRDQERPVIIEQRPVYREERPVIIEQRPVYREERPVIIEERHNEHRDNDQHEGVHVEVHR